MPGKQTRKDSFRLDANESAIFARQLEYIKAKTYDTKYKDLKAYMLIPISTEAPNGATQITYRKFTGVGFAQIISDYAQDFPRVDVYGEEVTIKIKGIGDSFGYSIKEIRSSQMAGTRLDQRRAKTAKQAIEQLINSIGLTGDSDFGLTGLLNYSGMTEYTLIADGVGSSKTWAAKTPDQIVRDVTGLVSAVVVPTNGKEIPTILILPLTQYLYIANTRMTDGNSKTILQYIMENNPFLQQIEWVAELSTAGTGSTTRMMVYPKDENNLTMELPQPFEQFPPQQKGMEFEIPCHAETAGVLVYYPLSIAFADGI